MSYSHDLRMQLLESKLARRGLLDQMLAGAEMVKAGGVEGIKLAAETEPELILTVIDVLVHLARKQADEIDRMDEHTFELHDAIDAHTDKNSQ